jgi:hypothetical protein
VSLLIRVRHTLKEVQATGTSFFDLFGQVSPTSYGTRIQLDTPRGFDRVSSSVSFRFPTTSTPRRLPAEGYVTLQYHDHVSSWLLKSYLGIVLSMFLRPRLTSHLPNLTSLPRIFSISTLSKLTAIRQVHERRLVPFSSAPLDLYPAQ